MLENLIVGLILAFVPAITFVAYKHPNAYRRISEPIGAFAPQLLAGAAISTILWVKYEISLLSDLEEGKEIFSLHVSSIESIQNSVDLIVYGGGICLLIYVYHLFLLQFPKLFPDASSDHDENA